MRLAAERELLMLLAGPPVVDLNGAFEPHSEVIRAIAIGGSLQLLHGL